MTPPIHRIAIVTGDYRLPDETKHGARYAEQDLATHAAMLAAFETIPGFEFTCWDDHATLLDTLTRERPDLVVNFCDTGYRNQPTLELHVPAYLELLGIPYTGATPAAIVLCFDKAIVRACAQELGIPVPREQFVAADAAAALPDRYPALLKPNRADGSVGITQHALVRDREQARAYLGWLRETFPGRDLLVQEYLPGPEYGIGLIGNPDDELRAFPALEVDFSRLPQDLAPILGFESKAVPDSPYWTDIAFRRAQLAPDEEQTLVAHCRRLFRRLGLRDYARFDFRRGADGEIKLMEVNPNPAWANDGKLAFMAGFADVSYPRMLELLLRSAITRVGRERAAAARS